MLEVQKYLRSGKTVEDLEKEYSIYNRIKGNKVLLSYDQVFSPMGEKICQECRGIILEKDSWDVIACGFYKFFNLGEGAAPKIDINSAKILEKIDGSNVNQYYYENWCFSTRSVPEADIPNQSGITFADLAKLALKDMGIDYDDFCRKLNKRFTYMFELTSPMSQVYIYYPDNKLYLIGVRDIDSMQELPIEGIAAELNLPTPQEYNFYSIEDIVKFVGSRKGTEHEGVVLKDKNFNRIKIKSDQYKDGQAVLFSLAASDRNVMRLILLDEYDDFLPKVPDYVKTKMELYKAKLGELTVEIKNDYDAIKDIDNQKDYAIIATKKRFPAALFEMRKSKISVEEIVKKQAGSDSGVDKMLNLCGIKEKK